MSFAPWRSPLARALHRNRSLVYARYFQLATVRASECPAVRTVVFRGFWNDTNQLKMVTDARNEKAAQIDRVPYGEACWYFPNTREQFRLAGALTLVRKDNSAAELRSARQQAWQELSDAARAQFAWSHPGRARDEEGFNAPPPDSTAPLPHFCLLLLNPTWVDHLELRGDPQNRWLYQYDSASGWAVEAVNP